MCASRQTYSIKFWFKHPPEYYNSNYSKYEIFIFGLKNIWCLFNKIKNNKYNRSCFYQDNFKSPFNKLIGCKLFGHDWFYIEDDNRLVCKKCYKSKILKISGILYKRQQKIYKIKKRIKK